MKVTASSIASIAALVLAALAGTTTAQSNSTCLKKCDVPVSQVCGSNNVTYDNKCLFDIARCQTSTLEISANSSCEAFKSCTPLCTSNTTEPVCGSDGFTYTSSCSVDYAKCKDPSLVVASRGRCNCEDPCPPTLAPVCGSDGKTYDNKCQLDRARCKDRALEILNTGACVQGTREYCNEKFQVNTLEFSPFCGSDGVAYGNLGEFRRAICLNTSLKLVNRYGCNCSKLFCFSTSSPVCANNNVTYASNCEFAKAQCNNSALTIVKDGACVEQSVTSAPKPTGIAPSSASTVASAAVGATLLFAAALN